MKINKYIIEIIKQVAEKCEFETEYDGRMESYCFYCDSYTSHKTTHKKNCLHLKAKRILRLMKKRKMV